MIFKDKVLSLILLLLINNIKRKVYKVKKNPNYMVNFLEHLARENDTMRATMAWITALREKGLIVRAMSLSTLASTGKSAEMVGKAAGPDYVTAEDMLRDMYIAGLPISCEPLKKEPYIRATHLDPDKTLAALRNRGIIKPDNPFREAIQYLSHLKQYGVNITPGTWENILAEEHRHIIDTPLKEVELCAASGRLITRCSPGWSDAHTSHARYRLMGAWNDNPVLRGIIESYSEEGRFRLTDTLCDVCDQFRTKEIEEMFKLT